METNGTGAWLEKLDKAFTAGQAANATGYKRAPYHDRTFIATLEGLEIGGRLEMLRAWLRGWDRQEAAKRDAAREWADSQGEGNVW